VTRNRFVLLAVVVVVLAFGVGLSLGLSTGSTGAATASNAPLASATATPTTPTTAAAITELPTSLYTGCQPRQSPVGTAVSCSSTLAGVDEVLVVKWPDAATMQSDFTRTQGGKPDGKCSTYKRKPLSGISSTWGNGKPLACYVNSNGAAVVLWEVPERALELLAVRRDGDTKKAFEWWNQAIKTPFS
jgi:hypothetical protein